MQKTHDIVVARGDGIGPEIMEATLSVLSAAQVSFNIHEVLLGEQAYLNGFLNGVEDTAWSLIEKHKTLLKAPLSTPSGSGYKSANVTIRKTLGMYANVRPSTTYHPILKGPEKLNIVIIRENEEDLYAGIEHRQTADVVQCLKIITRPGCERISHYAFEYARQYGRKRITCLTKDNIMKMSDGLFHNIFNEVAAEYPDIQADHLIVDIGTARVATRPGDFDIVLAPNLYGDIISDVVAEVAGSIGLAPSANIGQNCSMFEAVHGSAPDIAGKGIANPSALLLSAVMMLVHLGELEKASLIHNAWLKTLEDGIYTGDMRPVSPREKVGTMGFAQAVIERLGLNPMILEVKNYTVEKEVKTWQYQPISVEKKLVGVDVFVSESARTADDLAELVQSLATANHQLRLQVITNRGVKVWPEGISETFCSDHWRLRFSHDSNASRPWTEYADVLFLLTQITAHCGLEVIKTENLYTFDGVNGFSAAQGQ